MDRDREYEEPFGFDGRSLEEQLASLSPPDAEYPQAHNPAGREGHAPEAERQGHQGTHDPASEPYRGGQPPYWVEQPPYWAEEPQHPQSPRQPDWASGPSPRDQQPAPPDAQETVVSAPTEYGSSHDPAPPGWDHRERAEPDYHHPREGAEQESGTHGPESEATALAGVEDWGSWRHGAWGRYEDQEPAWPSDEASWGSSAAVEDADAGSSSALSSSGQVPDGEARDGDAEHPLSHEDPQVQLYGAPAQPLWAPEYSQPWSGDPSWDQPPEGSESGWPAEAAQAPRAPEAPYAAGEPWPAEQAASSPLAPEQDVAPPEQDVAPPQPGGVPAHYPGSAAPPLGAPDQYPGPPDQYPGAPDQYPGEQYHGPPDWYSGADQYPGGQPQYPGPPDWYPGGPDQYPGAPDQYAGRTPQYPAVPAQDVPPATAQTADSLNPETLLRGRRRSPSGGWRRAVYRASGGLVHPGESPAELRRRELTARARTVVAGGHHRVAVVSLKGGVGKTTTTIGLGSTLAALRGDRVVAIDANPDRGTLSDKLRLETAATVRDLLNERDGVRRYADVRAFTSQAPSRLEVLASDRDPAVSEAFSEDDYRAVASVLEHFYSICITDSGTGLLHSAMSGVLRLANQIVLVSSPSVDGARSASATLDWLEAHEFGRLVRNATVVLSAVNEGGKSTVDLTRLEQHFASRCNAVVRIPNDPHLEEGAEVELDQLKPATREAYLLLAATVAGNFGHRRGVPVSSSPAGDGYGG